MSSESRRTNNTAQAIDAEALVKRTWNAFYDNGRYSGSSTNTYGDPVNLVRFQHAFEACGLETDRGVLGVGDLIGPATGWTNQFDDPVYGWQQHFASMLPWATVTYAPQPAPMWRAIKVETCDPRARVGKWTLKRVDGSGEACVYPVKLTIEYDYCWRKEICDEKSGVRLGFEWYVRNEDGTYQQAEQPADAECYVPRDFNFLHPVLDGGESPCETQTFTVCDDNNAGARVLVFVHDCDGVRSIEYYDEAAYLAATDPSDIDAAEYDISDWKPTDCNDPSIPWEEPPAPCPFPEAFAADKPASSSETLYENDDNTTDLGFSVGVNDTGLDQLKFDITQDPPEADAVALQQAIIDCVDSGGEVTLTWDSPGGTAYEFLVAGYSGAAGGSMLLEGDSVSGTGAGKVGSFAKAVCSVGSGEGKALRTLGCLDQQILDAIRANTEAVNDLKACLMIEKPDDDTDDGDGFAPLYPVANGKIVSDNFQDGNGNAPFNLQVRNTTGNAVNWQACTPGAPYATIPSLNAPAGVAYEVIDNGDGTYLHCFSGENLGAFQNVIITGGLPSPAGSGGANNLSLYCEAA